MFAHEYMPMNEYIIASLQFDMRGAMPNGLRLLWLDGLGRQRHHPGSVFSAAPAPGWHPLVWAAHCRRSTAGDPATCISDPQGREPAQAGPTVIRSASRINCMHQTTRKGRLVNQNSQS